MSGLPPDLPPRNPVHSSVTAMSVQSNLSSAGAASATAVRAPGAGTAVGSPRQSGAYHSSPSDGGLHVGANHISPPATAAPSPTFHGFRPAFQSGVLKVTNAGTAVVGGASIPQTLHRSAPNITQAVAQPVYFRPLPPGHMAFARPAVPQPPPSNMLSSASVPFGGGRVSTAAYRTYTPLIPRPAAIDSPRTGVGDVATPGQPGGVTPLATSGGFRGFSSGGGSFGHGQVKTLRIPPHHKELLPRPSSSPSPIAPTDSASADSDMAPPKAVTADAPSEVPAISLAEAEAGSIAGASSPRTDEESRAMASKIGSCGEPSSVTFVEVEVRAAGTQVVNDKNQKLPQHTSLNMRMPRTLLPAGYLERCRGKVCRSSEAVPKGAIYAALHSDSNNSKRHSSSRGVMTRWLLTEDQILGDIKCMMENLPKGVVIASARKEKENDKEAEKKMISGEEAVLDPRLTPSEKEWLKIARQEDIEDQGNRGVAENVDGVDEARGAEGAAASARNKDATTNAVDATGGTKRDQTSNESPSEGTAAVEGAATEAALAKSSPAAGIDAAVTSAGLAAESQAVEGRAALEGVALEGVQPKKGKAEGGTETVESKESEEREPPLAIPTRRELMELDAKRDALELKETMILERARERQRCLTKERAKGHAVIQFLTRLEREDRSRTNLLRAKRFFVLAVARVLEQRVSESDDLLEQIEILKGLKRAKGDHPSRSPNGECSSAAASQSESKQSEQAATKGKGKARAAWHSRHLMHVDEEADGFGAAGRSSLPGEHAMTMTLTSNRRDCGSGCGFGEGDEKGEVNASRNKAVERSEGWGSGAALVGDDDLADVHSVTAHAMRQCWDALCERLAAARKVVREAGVDTGDASAANAVGGAVSGAVGRSRGGKGKSRRANPMDVDDFGDGGQSSPSSDEDSDVSGTVRFQGPRSRRKKMARQAGAASVATGVPIRKRGRKAQGQGQGTVGSGAVQDAVERERLDWPSTIIPRTPYNVPLLVSCLSTYPDKVVAALHPAPEPRWRSKGNGDSNKDQNKDKGEDTQDKQMQPRQGGDSAASASSGSHGREAQAFGFKADLLPGFSREEKLRQAHLHDRAVFEQVESMTRMYAEAVKMLTEQRANSPKLKGAFKSERHQDDRQTWRQELEDLQAAVARAMPPPPSDGTWKEDAWNDGSEDKTNAKSKRGTAEATRAQSKDSPPVATASASTCRGAASPPPPPPNPWTTPPLTCPPRSLPRAANSASHPTNPIKSAAANPASHPTNPIKSDVAVSMVGKGGKDVAFASASAWPSTSAPESSSASVSAPACTSASPSTSISASTVDSMGARKGRPARGAAKPPSPGVGRRTSTRGNESKARG